MNENEITRNLVIRDGIYCLRNIVDGYKKENKNDAILYYTEGAYNALKCILTIFENEQLEDDYYIAEMIFQPLLENEAILCNKETIIELMNKLNNK